MRGSSELLGIASACCVVLSAPFVGAEPDLRVALDYRVDASLDGCPDESGFHAMVESQLGYDPFLRTAPDRVIARIHADRGRARGALEWRNAEGTLRGERELTSESGTCQDLARTMSFAVAVQIQLLEQQGASEADDTSNTARPTPADPGARRPPTEPRAGARAAQDAEVRPPRANSVESASPQAVVGVGPFVGFGVAPETVFGGRLFAALRIPTLSLELAAESALPSERPTSNGEGVEHHWVVGASAGCLHLPPLSACVLGKVGRLKVRGFGVDERRSASGLVALLGPRLGFEQSMGKDWFAGVHLGVLATLATWRVELNHEEVWSAPPVTIFLGADVASIFQ